jgi:hypothetical protein
MRSNAWQITAIIAIILVVVLIVPLVIMGRQQQTLYDNEKNAKKEQSEAAQKAAKLEEEVKDLKKLISKPGTASLDELQKQHAEIMGKAQPGENDSVRTYYETLTVLLGDLDKEREGRKATQDKYAQLESDFNNEKSKNDALLAKEMKERRLAENARDKDKREFLSTKEDYDQKFKEAQEKQNATLAKAEREKFALNDRATQLEISNRDIRDTNTNLASMLEDVRNPNVECPAGKIISVDQEAGLAVVNLGSADGLMVRTMFSVYHPSITGLSFRTAPVGRDPIYCDVCKREVSRDVSKASIEVMRILSPHRAEVRILDDILTDPIMVGDVVYSPIWRPGQKLRFALTAGMRLPGSVAGSEAVRRLIESNGGVVDCWIEDHVASGEDHLKGSMTDLTNYIVVNEGAAHELDPEVASIQAGLLDSARNKAIKTISLGDLLNRMGWKNVTPVYTFGSQTFTPDMRVVPLSQSAVQYSGGHVSPKFTPDNADARVNAREAAPTLNSTGIVSPLFSDQAPPPPASSGRTSDLFRPRSPATE